MKMLLHGKKKHNDRTFQLYEVEYESDGKICSAYFYALSREHASYRVEEMRATARLGPDITGE